MTWEEINEAAQLVADDWLGTDARGTIGYAGLVIAVREAVIKQVNIALEELADDVYLFGGPPLVEAIVAHRIKS